MALKAFPDSIEAALKATLTSIFDELEYQIEQVVSAKLVELDDAVAARFDEYLKKKLVAVAVSPATALAQILATVNLVACDVQRTQTELVRIQAGLRFKRMFLDQVVVGVVKAAGDVRLESRQVRVLARAAMLPQTQVEAGIFRAVQANRIRELLLDRIIEAVPKKLAMTVYMASLEFLTSTESTLGY